MKSEYCRSTLRVNMAVNLDVAGDGIAAAAARGGWRCRWQAQVIGAGRQVHNRRRREQEAKHHIPNLLTCHNRLGDKGTTAPIGSHCLHWDIVCFPSFQIEKSMYKLAIPVGKSKSLKICHKH